MKKTQIEYYATELNKLKRMPEINFAYMLPHYKTEKNLLKMKKEFGGIGSNKNKEESTEYISSY